MNDSLGDRMKRSYEQISSQKLVKRVPVICRLDGRAFHTFTKQIKAIKPFDDRLIDLMSYTALYLCKNISGARLAYVQSDEISILITDYDTITTQGWFDYKIQKMVSISSSMATAYFNRYFDSHFQNMGLVPLVNFDSRVFNIPKEEVCNYYLWRQNDWTRNSIQMLARSLFSHKECENKNSSELQDMLMLKYNVNWNDLEAYKKRGTCIYKELEFRDDNTTRTRWKIDKDIPIFTQDRSFIDKWTMSGNVEELLKGWNMAEHGIF